MKRNHKGLYRNYTKRLLDIVLSSVGIVVLSPVLVGTAVLVRVKLGSPVFFRQPRPGLHEKIFYLCKFRSMTNETGEDGRLLPDAQRLTGLGKFLRASSLDELPELLNILKGDMSIVGPRPLSIFYLPHYPEEFRGRHDVRPGLTGLAQVNGRNSLPWDDRFTLDMQYVDNVSFLTDVRIILETALKVVRRSDVAVRGTAKIGDYGPYCVLKEEKAGGTQMDGMKYSEIGSYFWLEDGTAQIADDFRVEDEDGIAKGAGNLPAEKAAAQSADDLRSEDGAALSGKDLPVEEGAAPVVKDGEPAPESSRAESTAAGMPDRKGAPAEYPQWLPAADDWCYTFSGRYAIDAVLRDLLEEREVKSVYVPSYCCVSMLQPFIDRGIRTEFYRVVYENGVFVNRLPEVSRGSVVLIMSYFGLSTKRTHEDIRRLHEKGAVVIEDITHSLLSAEPMSGCSDYAVASLRKWFASPAGGWAGKRAGALRGKPDLDSDHAVEEKVSAMKEKYAYLSGQIDDKEHFLLAQAKFDNDLIHVDHMLKIDSVSRQVVENVCPEEVREARRKNAAVLLEGLKDLEGPLLQLPEADLEADTPLFLPVFLEHEDRDLLRQYLVNRGIYCPVHWPEVMGGPAGIRENELSLICDQRYGEGDMRAIAAAIHAWADTIK